MVVLFSIAIISLTRSSTRKFNSLIVIKATICFKFLFNIQETAKTSHACSDIDDVRPPSASNRLTDDVAAHQRRQSQRGVLVHWSTPYGDKTSEI